MDDEDIAEEKIDRPKWTGKLIRKPDDAYRNASVTPRRHLALYKSVIKPVTDWVSERRRRTAIDKIKLLVVDGRESINTKGRTWFTTLLIHNSHSLSLPA